MANEIVFKEELGPILNTIIRETPKSLPAVLNKGDIVKYGNYLYKYKGENGVRKGLVDEGSFKKVGLRYKDDQYKVILFNEMIEVYQYLFEKGLNGDNITRNWTISNVNLRKNGFSHGVEGFPRVYINWSSTVQSIRDMLKDKFKCTEEEASVINQSNYRKREFPIIKSAALNAEIMREYNDILERFNRGETTFPKYTYFQYTNASRSFIKSYESRLDIFEKRDGFLCYQIKEDSFSYGIFGREDLNNYEKTKRIQEISILKEADEDDHTTGSLMLNLRKERGYQTGTTRFWLPYFNDIIRDDTNGSSARKLNENHNHYGLYFDIYEEGIYEFSFTLYATDKNQHEEWGTKGPWGARYAFYPNSDNVRGDGDSWCNFKKDRGVHCKLRFKYDAGTFSNIEILTEDVSDEIRRFINEMLNGKGYQTFGNRIYIKIFYAIWSFDDLADWNEWQFAHVTAPYILEYKGEE